MAIAPPVDICALAALERLQRLRRGEFVPPTVRVVVEG